MELFVLCRGRWGRVVYAAEQGGGNRASTFFEGLSSADRVKMGTLFKRFAEFGEIKNREKFKKIADDLFEFKSHQVRMFCFIDARTVVLTHGCIKKRDALNSADIERAQRIKAEHLKALAQPAGKFGVQRPNKK